MDVLVMVPGKTEAESTMVQLLGERVRVESGTDPRAYRILAARLAAAGMVLAARRCIARAEYYERVANEVDQPCQTI